MAKKDNLGNLIKKKGLLNLYYLKWKETYR